MKTYLIILFVLTGMLSTLIGAETSRKITSFNPFDHHLKVEFEDDEMYIFSRDNNDVSVRITDNHDLIINERKIKLTKRQKKAVQRYCDELEHYIDDAVEIGVEAAEIGLEGVELGIHAVAESLAELIADGDFDELEKITEKKSRSIERAAKKLERKAEKLERRLEKLEDLHLQLKDEIEPLEELDWF